MTGGQGGPRFPGFGVGRGFAIWGPFPVQAPVKAPESCTSLNKNLALHPALTVVHGWGGFAGFGGFVFTHGHFRPLFRALYPHPADKSALRAEDATHFLAPGKPGRPPMSTWPLFSRNSQFTTTSYDPSPLATAIHRLPDWVKIERGPISTIGLSL